MDQATTRKVAHLAKLALTDEELQKITDKLNLVLSHFEHIAEVNTEGVDPLVTPSDIPQVLRADEVSRELATEQILANAPAKQGNLFKVPPVI